MANSANVANAREFGRGPAAVVRRWLKEIDLAEKEEKAWRSDGEKISRRYRGDMRRKNSFNILWSNTETLVPALFNTPPSPDVRRRFRDEDPVGKVASQMLERVLAFQTDNECFMHSVRADVLDAVLPGRGLSRVKYVPTLVSAEGAEEKDEAEGGTLDDDDKIVAWEQVEIEHVQWDDFRHGPGKVWGEVPWIAFRHRMSRDELEDLAGPEIAALIPLDQTSDDEINKDNELQTIFGTALVWEVWDKEERMVRYVCPGYRAAPLKEMDDPLRLVGFWPCPRPIYAIRCSDTLIPTPLFEQYREQADELDRLSQRINQIVAALRVRGIYDATMGEVNELMRAHDNQLIPIQNAALWAEKGGLEKAIYWLPIDKMAAVLAQLYEAREQAKQTVYELSGIADVRRGATDPNETLGAQRLKADFGNQRISGLKLEVERYVRDLMRLMAEIAAERFSPDTLTRMSQLKVPTEAEVQAKAAEMTAQIMQQAQAQGQQISPQQALQQLPQRPVTLEQVMEVLHDDAMRAFKIDVETDSMIAATAEQDMAGLREVLTAVAQIMSAFGPAVQAGAMPVEAVKEVILTVCRRAKMGTAVEDAMEKIQPPRPQADPNAAKAQAALQMEQIKAQAAQQANEAKARADAEVAQIKAATDARTAQIEAAAQQQTDIVRQQAEQAQHQAKLQHEAQLAALKAQFEERDRMRDMEFQRWKAELDAATKIETANIAAKAKVDNAATDAATSEIASEVTQ